MSSCAGAGLNEQGDRPRALRGLGRRWPWYTGSSRAADIEREKRLAAEAAAELVESGMTVGLGTGSTAMYLLAPLAARNLDIRCVATSPVTAQEAVRLGLEVVDFVGFDAPAHLDIAIDGADQVDRCGWLVKGG